MSSLGLLQIDPVDLLTFPFELKKHISCPFHLTNNSDDYVAFKVKTTNPTKYCVRPNSGIVQPRSTCDVTVTMQAQREAPEGLQCKDRFLVQSVIIDNGADAKGVTTEMFSKESGHLVEEIKLRVVYVEPPQPPSPVAEGSEEGSPLRPALSDNDISKDSELVSAKTKHEASERNKMEKSSETSTLILRLTENKNAAMQANYRLRQEIELVRQEVVKRQRGLSLKFAVIIALLGFLLGYIVKK